MGRGRTEGRPSTVTPEEILSEYDRAIALLVDLMQDEGRRRGQGSRFKVLTTEAQIRLEQSASLLRRFRAAELELSRSARRTYPHLGRLEGEIRLNGEAFYYFAWRVKKTLGVLSNEAGLDLRFTPVGVRTVRNQLIEHPDGRNGQYILSWRWACPEGLVLEPVGIDGFGLDKGIYPNAQEFIGKLLVKLTSYPLLKALEKGGA